MKIKKDKTTESLVAKPEKKNYVTAKHMIKAQGAKIEVINHDIKELTKIVTSHGLSISNIRADTIELNNLKYGISSLERRYDTQHRLNKAFFFFAVSSVMFSGLILYYLMR